METAMQQGTALGERVHEKLFDLIYSRALIYNTCWEDPAVDREALELRAGDTLLVITSAGCNVLDYALTGPRRIHAVDANPRQTALLELKLAGIRRLEFEDFFAVFGKGRHPRFRDLLRGALRAELSPFAAAYWDTHAHWFTHAEGSDSFYFHGLSGRVARLFRGYLGLRPRLRYAVEDLLCATSLDEQRRIYDEHIAPLLWGRAVNWALSRQITMSLLGVPHAQHDEVRRQHAGGVPGFVREAVEYVFRCLPAWTNYFWSLYVRGAYSASCCPEYLKEANFAALKGGLVDSIVPHTCTVTAFLHGTDERISRFVLLDHMDWMSSFYPRALAEEWQAILERAAPGARVIFRSAHANPGYLESLRIPAKGGERLLREVVRFEHERAAELQLRDRVHTYAGFHIGELRPQWQP
jgi:S-adenosylmethionine-diacylglycerol 3-amino-3-carboxypropyl transferase